MSNFATFRGSRAALTTAIRDVPRAAAGKVADTSGLTRVLMLRAGVGLLSQIQQAFLVKSRGNQAIDGVKWVPLKPETIARRRVGRGELTKLGINKKALNKAQQAERKRVYGEVMAEMRARGVPESHARDRAEKIAERRARLFVAKARRDALSSRRVDVLRDTSLLFRSFAPGIEDSPSRPAGQILRFLPGQIVVGTNQKPWHHHGNPARNLPARPFWPVDGRLPDQWWQAMADAFARGLVRAVSNATVRPRR